MAGWRGSRQGFGPRTRGTREVGVGLSVPASVAIAGAAAPRDQSPPGWRGGSAGSGRHRGLRREIGGGRVEPVGGVTDLAEGVVDRAQDLGAERTGEVLGRASERRGVVRPERERPGAERPPRPDAGGIVEARPRRHQPEPWGATDGGRPVAEAAVRKSVMDAQMLPSALCQGPFFDASPAPGEARGALFVYAGTITSVSGHTCAPPRAIDGACTGVLITPAQVGALLRDDGSEKVKNRRSRKTKNRIRVGSRR